MSDVADLPIVVLQKTHHAAQAAVEFARRLESEVSHRLTAIEARLTSIERRLSLELDAGQTARFDAIEQSLAAILAKLP